MSVTINGTNGITFNDTSLQTAAGLGYGQTYQDVTASRANNTNYTNTTGRPIWVNVLTSGSPANAQTNRLYCDNIIVCDMNNDSNFQSVLTAIIPPGSVYKVVLQASISRWLELR